MKKKRILASLLSVCLALAPVMSASASQAGTDRGGGTALEGEIAPNGQETAPETVQGTVPEKGKATLSGNNIVKEGEYAQTLAEDFEGAEGNWGMEGTLSGAISIAEANGNHFLQVQGTKLQDKVASKKLGDLPDMTTAKVTFDWNTLELTADSNNGRAGVVFMEGPVVAASIYVGGVRNADKTKTVDLFYAIEGGDFVKVASWTKPFAEHGEKNVEMAFDFTAHTAVITVNGTASEEFEINPWVSKVDTIKLDMNKTPDKKGDTYSVNMRVDNLNLQYNPSGESVNKSPFISTLTVTSPVEATKADYEKGFEHFAKADALLSDGSHAEVEIDSSTWVCDKTFKPDEIGTYVWTAQVKLPEDGSIINPLNKQVSYTMNYMAGFVGTDIDSLVRPKDQNCTKEAWESGTYAHPKTVVAKLVNGLIVQVPIDQNSWTCEPAFDLDKMASYVWTANLAPTADNGNPRGLKVSYTMNYTGSYVSEHDYENTFVFGQIDWNVWGKDVDKDSGTGGYSLQIKETDGDKYLFASNGDGTTRGRGSRLDLPGGIVKGAVMEFDWNPVKVNQGHADLLFMSPAANQNYFTLYADATGKIYYYTKSDANNASSINDDFPGVIGKIISTTIGGKNYEVISEAASTEIGALNEWFNVKVEFDYIAHTAKLTVTSKKDPAQTFTKDNIPISPDANGLSLMVMRKHVSCAASENALDNIFVDYTGFDAKDIVALKQPADVTMTALRWEDYEFPKTVKVTLGDGTKVNVPVGEWTSAPEFNKETPGTYVWTAPLVLDGTGYTNYFNLQATFTMTYSLLPYVSSVNNPPTLELNFGEAWDVSQLPTTATVILNDASKITDAAVGEWTAIREFDAGQEGIYVYGANLVEDAEGRFDYIKERIMPEGNHENKDAAGNVHAGLANLLTYQTDKWVYDVYYRISYYEPTADNYNGIERSMEYLDRGVTAVPSNGGILVSWRLLAEEYGTDVQFNVLRNGSVINANPITDKTNFRDVTGAPGNHYAVQVIKNGTSVTTDYVTALSQNYLPIKVQKPDPQPDRDGNLATYTLNDAGAADVDGDGQYEIVVKWYPSDAFDSGKQDGPSAPTLFDFYEMDGTPLWRLNMGLEMPSGAHFNQFMFYDLDEDGKAEFFIKTSDGTVSYKPNADGLFDMTDKSTIVSYIGDESVVPGTNIRSTGHAEVTSNEYVTVFNGRTGEEIDTIEYVNHLDTGKNNFDSYGDNWGNRSSRFNIALAYLPGGNGTVPAVLLNRGYYNRTTVAAYTLQNGKLHLEWNFDEPNGGRYSGKGNHNVATGDVDNDGYDELVIGALAIDHDGSVLWCKDGYDGQDFQGHSDAIHLSAMNPADPTQLYVFTPSEETVSTLNGMVSNASNGSRINGMFSEKADIGRGVAANITPNPGFEYWANNPNSESDPTGAIFNFCGDVIATVPPSTFTTNWTTYWDGDLLSELPDGRNPGGSWTNQTVYKYNWETNDMEILAEFEGTHTNNTTKNNPSLTADLFGDWREEIMVPNSDNTELRIYTTNFETDYMIYSLMQDPVYRNAVANQNSAYNQPPHLGFYLGEDNRDTVLSMGLPTPNIRYTTDGSESEDEKYEWKVETVEDEAAVKAEFDELLSGSKGDVIKEATKADTAEKLVEYMTNQVIAAGKGLGEIPVSQTKVLEIKVIVKVNGKEVEVTDLNFPTGGVDITLPYPEGTNKDDFEFAITHLITTGVNAGQIESFGSVNMLDGGLIVKADEGLMIHITGASPFAIAWQAKDKVPDEDPKPTEPTDPKPTDPTDPKPTDPTDPKPTDPTDPKPGKPSEPDNSDDGDDDQDVENVVQNTKPPKSGDHMNTALIVWMIILAAAVAGIGTMFVVKRRGKAE